MRRVFLWSLVLLGLVLLLRYEASRGKISLPGASQDSLNLICFSRGALLPDIVNALTKQYPLRDGIIAGERVLQFDQYTQGLRVAVFDERFSLVGHENYELGREPQTWVTLADRLRSLPGFSIAVFQNQGMIALPPQAPPELAGQVRAFLALLGAEARPDLVPNSSWAMVSLKTPDGWVKLAETFSSRQGVTLSFAVEADLSGYDGNYSGDFAVYDDPRTSSVLLADNFFMARFENEAWKHQPFLRINQVPARCISADLSRAVQKGASRETGIRWEWVRLGVRPRFHAVLGYTVKARAPWPEFIYTLSVDGHPVQSERIKACAGWAPSWEPMTVDLGRYAGMTISLELKITQEGGAVPGWAFFGDAELG
ncbi:MAG: hypothetical protein KJ645_13240, partial [Planctomycetes bacterium]|nr:hypothetical protein [Planctomycetota bacterium]